MIVRVWVRLIWVGLWLVRPFRKPDDPHCEVPKHRDYEWTETRYCELHGGRFKHHCIEWADEHVVSARCLMCGFEGTL
jgi:hypothetical protein